MLPWPGKHPGHGRRRLLPKGGLSAYALCVLICGAILYIGFMAHHLARAEGGLGAGMLRRRLHNAAVRLSLRYEGLTQALGASRPTSAPGTTHRKQQRKHASRRADGSSNDRRAGSAAPFAEVIPRAAQEGVTTHLSHMLDRTCHLHHRFPFLLCRGDRCRGGLVDCQLVQTWPLSRCFSLRSWLPDPSPGASGLFSFIWSPGPSFLKTLACLIWSLGPFFFWSLRLFSF